MAVSQTLIKVSNFPVGLTFDDVLLVPNRSSISHRNQVSEQTRFSKHIKINIPVVSASMDTVTEEAMAISVAQCGGIGVIHRFNSIVQQVEIIEKVKRAESFKIDEPYTCSPTSTVENLREASKNYASKSFMVVNDKKELLGIVTDRDMVFASENQIVSEIMTPREKLIVAQPDISLEDARRILHDIRKEKLPLVDSTNHLRGLITARDIINHMERPQASMSAKGQLLVAAAVGVKPEDIERAQQLVKAGCDAIIVDIAHGHSDLCINQTRKLRELLPGTVDVIAGNVATLQGTKDLIEAGADAVKVGVGPGSICTTRLVTGCGVPQLTAIMECVEGAIDGDIPIIADGGMRSSGDLVKAIAAGASCCMLGSMLAGTDESPGIILVKGGRKVKVLRGMAGYGAALGKKENEGVRGDVYDLIPEGVEATVPYRGPVKTIIHQLAGGIASGISYCGYDSIAGLRGNGKFIRMTESGRAESGHHDVTLL